MDLGLKSLTRQRIPDAARRGKRTTDKGKRPLDREQIIAWLREDREERLEILWDGSMRSGDRG